MARLGRLALASAIAFLSLHVALGARQAVAGRGVRVAVGPMRLLDPGFGYAVAYRTVQHGTAAQTSIRLYVYDRGRLRNATPPMLRADGIDAIDAVDFVDERHGWVAAYNCATVAVHLYRTGDGGRSWQSLGEPASHSCGGGPTYLSFVDDRHGWMEPVSPNAPAGALLETSNGGRSWTRIATGPAGQGRGHALPCLAPIRFIAPSTGWMGRCEVGGVFSAVDGGRRWRRVTITVPEGADARFDLPWFSGSEGVVSAIIGTRPFTENGRTRSVVFSVTRDGGRSWTVRSTRRIAACPLNGYFTNLWPASVADPRTWWIVAGGSRPVSQVTIDGGRTWRTSRARGLPRRACSIIGVSAAGPKTAWVVARESRDGTALFGTVDAGRSWRRLP